MKQPVLKTFALLLIQLLTTAGASADESSPPSNTLTSPSMLTWSEDYQAATQKAVAQNKLLLLFFTGSDWCGWCMKMDKEIFSTKEFLELAGNAFIFVKLDFPSHTPQKAEIQIQNKELQEKFKVHGYPTVLITEPNGKILATAGYRSGGGKAYAEYLLNLIPAASTTSN